ncbi:MAG TPA: hypothetical protein VJ824_12990 [Bacillota bacterium]|nr:hypothetical protein [Bacillota bacterium]
MFRKIRCLFKGHSWLVMNDAANEYWKECQCCGKQVSLMYRVTFSENRKQRRRVWKESWKSLNG